MHHHSQQFPRWHLDAGILHIFNTVSVSSLTLLRYHLLCQISERTELVAAEIRFVDLVFGHCDNNRCRNPRPLASSPSSEASSVWAQEPFQSPGWTALLWHVWRFWNPHAMCRLWAPGTLHQTHEFRSTLCQCHPTVSVSYGMWWCDKLPPNNTQRNKGSAPIFLVATKLPGCFYTLSQPWRVSPTVTTQALPLTSSLLSTFS